MNALVKSCAIIALTATLMMVSQAVAQSDTVIFVDIVNGSTSPPNRGQDGWNSDAHKFLQDALADADWLIQFDQNISSVEIWVAAGTYRPDQSDNNPQWLEDPTISFELRNNVRILGGFPEDPHTLHGGSGAEITDRDWEANPTILSGDLKAKHINATAVLDGVTIRGGITLRSAQPRFRDCIIALHEAAAVRCEDGSEALFHRCTFTSTDGDQFIVDDDSRIIIWRCRPTTTWGEATIIP